MKVLYGFMLLVGIGLLSTGIVAAIYIGSKTYYQFSSEESSFFGMTLTSKSKPSIVAGSLPNTWIVIPCDMNITATDELINPITKLELSDSSVGIGGGKIAVSKGAGAAFLALTILAFICGIVFLLFLQIDFSKAIKVVPNIENLFILIVAAALIVSSSITIYYLSSRTSHYIFSNTQSLGIFDITVTSETMPSIIDNGSNLWTVTSITDELIGKIEFDDALLVPPGGGVAFLTLIILAFPCSLFVLYFLGHQIRNFMNPKEISIIS